MCKYFCSLCKQDSNCAQTSNYDGPQEQPPLVEGGGRERNKEAVSARAKARHLHCPHHLHFGEAASRPCWRPWHHSRCIATPQERALRVWPVRREQATWHRQQAVLHQLVGHVLANRSPQEAPDGLTRAVAALGRDWFKPNLTKPSLNIVETNTKPLQSHMQTNVKLFVQTECKLLSNLDQTKIRLGAAKG